MFHTLVAYARARGDLPPSCYRVRPVRWVLDIRIDGGTPTMTVGPYDEGNTDAVPTMRRSGTLPMPFLAVDQAAYVLGASGGTVTPKQATARAAAWWQQMVEWMTGPNAHPAVGVAVVAAKTTTAHSEHLISERDTVAVRVQGIWLHRLPEAQAEWLRIVSARKGGSLGLCTACGETRQLANTLPNAIPAHLLPGLEHDGQLAVLPLQERARGVLPVCVGCGDLAASVLQTMLEEHGRSTKISGQNSRTVVFGLGSETADADAARLLQLIGATTPARAPKGQESV